MDKISRAVEKARRERQSKIGGKPADLSDIKYTVTKQVSLSRSVLNSNNILTGDGDEEFSHSYKVLRTRVWREMKDKGWNSLAVTSCNPGEGKTLTSINLSLSLAMMKTNNSVLLVDLDMRRPSLHKYLGLSNKYGISDYLTGGVGLEEILLNPGINRFVILPGKNSINNSSELLSSARMEYLIQEFKNRYPSRLVVFDLPPILSTDDVLVFSPYVDAVLLVVEEGVTKAEDITKALGMLKGAKLIGTVLNKSEEAVPVSY